MSLHAPCLVAQEHPPFSKFFSIHYSGTEPLDWQRFIQNSKSKWEWMGDMEWTGVLNCQKSHSAAVKYQRCDCIFCARCIRNIRWAFLPRIQGGGRSQWIVRGGAWPALFFFHKQQEQGWPRKLATWPGKETCRNIAQVQCFIYGMMEWHCVIHSTQTHRWRKRPPLPDANR